MGQKLLNLYPLPNVASCANFLTNPTCHNYSIPIHNSVDTDNETMRVDQNWAKDRLYFTGHIRRENSTNPSLLPYSGSTSFTHGELFGVNWEHSFSASMVNTARFGFNHQFFNTIRIPLTAESSTTTRLPEHYDSASVVWNTCHQSGRWLPEYWQRKFRYFGQALLLSIPGQFEVDQREAYVHVWRYVRYLREYEQDNYLGIGSISFNGGYTASDPTTSGAQPGTTTGNAVADLLLGDAINLTPPAPLGVDLLHVAGINWNLFVQDDIHVTPRLTVNLGLRYEIPPNYHSLDNNSGWNFNPANGGSLSWVSQSFVNGVKRTATAQGLTPYAPYLNCCVSNTLVPIDKKDFAPRIGIAWKPLPTDRFVVPAGYGIFYDTYMRYYDLIQNFDTNQLQTEFPNNTYSSGTGFEPVSPEPSLGKLWLPPITSAAY